MIYNYDRKEFLKQLYKQYGDLPKEIFLQIVEHKTKERNKPKKFILDKNFPGSILWINKQIEKTKKDIENHEILSKNFESKDFWNYDYSSKNRFLRDKLYLLKQEKNRMILDIRYYINKIGDVK